MLLPASLAGGVVAAMLYCQHKAVVNLLTSQPSPVNVNTPIHYMQTYLGGEREERDGR